LFHNLVVLLPEKINEFWSWEHKSARAQTEPNLHLLLKDTGKNIKIIKVIKNVYQKPIYITIIELQ